MVKEDHSKAVAFMPQIWRKEGEHLKAKGETLQAPVTSAKGPEAGEVCVFEKDKIVRREELYEMKIETGQKPNHKYSLGGYG